MGKIIINIKMIKKYIFIKIPKFKVKGEKKKRQNLKVCGKVKVISTNGLPHFIIIIFN